MCLAKDIVGSCGGTLVVVAYSTCPSAAIDVTCRTALDIGVGRSDEVPSNLLSVHDSSGGTGSIEVLGNMTAEEVDIGGAIDVAAGGRVVITQTTPVAVTGNSGTFLDADVGIVFLLGVITRCFPTVLPIDNASRHV